MEPSEFVRCIDQRIAELRSFRDAHSLRAAWFVVSPAGHTMSPVGQTLFAANIEYAHRFAYEDAKQYEPDYRVVPALDFIKETIIKLLDLQATLVHL